MDEVPELRPRHARFFAKVSNFLLWVVLTLFVVGMVVFALYREGRIWNWW